LVWKKTHWGLAPAFLACLLSAPQPCWAIGEWERGDTSLEAIGALRLTGALMHFPEIPMPQAPTVDGLAAAVARLLLEGDLGERLSYEVNLYGDFSRGPSISLGGALATVGAAGSSYRNKYLCWDFWDSGDVNGQLGTDRLALLIKLSSLEIRVGRMPINYAATNIFTPNDFFAPFSAASINKIYKPGVDALRLSWETSPLSSVELSAVMGSDGEGVASWSRTALLLRGAATWWDFQWAVMGGKLARKWVVGISWQGEAGPFGLRGEGHVGFPDQDGDGVLDGDEGLLREIHAHVAAGADMRFAWRNISLGLEVMYQSDGASHPGRYTQRQLDPDELPYLGQLYLGFSASGEIIPILHGSLLVMFNAQDLSGMTALTLLYNIADEADFVAGVLLPWGERPSLPLTMTGWPQLNSEFGMMPVTVFLETRFYF